jgi:hypothetical protein
MMRDVSSERGWNSAWGIASRIGGLTRRGHRSPRIDRRQIKGRAEERLVVDDCAPREDPDPASGRTGE